MKGGILEWHSRMCIVAVGNEFHQDIITEEQGPSGSCSFLGFETEAEWMAAIISANTYAEVRPEEVCGLQKNLFEV